MALRAVGFDIDGTLYPDLRAQLRLSGFFLSHMRTVLAFSRTRHIMRRRPDDQRMEGDPFEAELKIFADELGLGIEDARDIRSRVVYMGAESHLKHVRTYPGVRESLIRLKDAGLKLAALSDFPVGNKLDYFGVADLFDTALGFPESQRLKPRPEPFLVMADRLGVSPSEILYVGNKLDYDVHGAESAGMRGALIGPPGLRAPSDVLKYRNYRHLADSILTEVGS